ncbi:hypothetical protein ACLOJK_024230 [Asimina triloba]
MEGSFKDYMVFSTRGDVRAIDNPPDHVPGWWWTLTYFRRTALRWHPSREEFFRWCESMRFAAVEKGKKCALKRACQSEEGSILVDFDSSSKDASELSPTGGLPATTDHVDHRGASSMRESVVRLGSEGMVPSSDVAQLREELEASCAEVAHLQSILRMDDVRSLAKAKYLQSVAYHRRPLIALSNIPKLVLRFSLLVEVVGGFSHVVILSVSQRGRPFSGDWARAVPALVSKERRCQKYKHVGGLLCWRIPNVGSRVAYRS